MRFGRALTMLAVAIGALGLPGCSSNSQNEPERESVDHMWAHYSQVGEIQTALIRGDLAAARGPAEWISNHQELDGLPQSADEFTGQMRFDAERIVEASEMVTASLATGQLAATCGNCHRAFNSGPKFSSASGPPDGAGVTQSQMLRHLWAADRLWEGLIGPSDDAWSSGARMLAESPFFPGDVVETVGQWDDMRELARSVNALGKTAISTTDQSARADLYGELLVTCSSCHQLASAAE